MELYVLLGSPPRDGYPERHGSSRRPYRLPQLPRTAPQFHIPTPSAPQRRALPRTQKFGREQSPVTSCPLTLSTHSPLRRTRDATGSRRAAPITHSGAPLTSAQQIMITVHRYACLAPWLGSSGCRADEADLDVSCGTACACCRSPAWSLASGRPARVPGAPRSEGTWPGRAARWIRALAPAGRMSPTAAPA
jgi:hypothetical protein